MLSPGRALPCSPPRSPRPLLTPGPAPLHAHPQRPCPQALLPSTLTPIPRPCSPPRSPPSPGPAALRSPTHAHPHTLTRTASRSRSCRGSSTRTSRSSAAIPVGARGSRDQGPPSASVGRTRQGWEAVAASVPPEGRGRVSPRTGPSSAVWPQAGRRTQTHPAASFRGRAPCELLAGQTPALGPGQGPGS